MTSDWFLMKAGAVLGCLSSPEVHQPWFVCRFAPTPEFEGIRPLFEDELRLLNADEMKEWKIAYGRIDALQLRLQSTDGTETIDDFLLHIDGTKAWFRY